MSKLSDLQILILGVAICVMSITAGVSYVNGVKNKAIAAMVATGVNPQAAMCAVDGINSLNVQVCAALVATSSK